MDKLIRIHRDPEQLDFKKLWNEGVFVFDSNVLLDLYRLPVTARKDLISILESDKFKDRIWIGFQVILEFLNNRYEAISDQKNKFHSVRSILNDSLAQYVEMIDTLQSELNKLKLKQRHSLIDPEKHITDKNIDTGIKFIHDFLDNLDKLEKKQSDVDDADNIKEIVLKVFEGKIGSGFDKTKLQEIYKEGEKRYDNKIPPGYKDIKKEGAHIYEDREHVRRYGDLILWKEIIELGKASKPKYLVLVTGDVKEDWWFEKRGKKLGPRNELLNEIYTECPDLDTFFMYDTSTFLQYAKKELKLDIKESSIAETKELIELSRQDRIEDEEGFVSIPDMIREIASKIGSIKAGLGNSVKNLPKLKINKQAFYVAFSEILINVIDHGMNNYVGVQAKDRDGMIMLRFRNVKKLQLRGEQENSLFRGKGIEYVKATMHRENVDVHIVEDEKSFAIELYIPKESA